MKKSVMSLLFILSGIPAWKWALPTDAWRSTIAPHLPAALVTLLAQMPPRMYVPYVWAFSIVWSVLFMADFYYYQSIGTKPPRTDPRTGYEEVDEGVPHARFRRTPDGFTALIRNNDWQKIGEFLFAATVLVGVIGLVVTGDSPGSGLAVAIGSAISYVWGYSTPTCITVTPRVIRVRDHFEDRVFDREHFVAFKPHEHWLSCEYGKRNYFFSGRLPPIHVVEIAASLNHLLTEVPVTQGSRPYGLPSERSEF